MAQINTLMCDKNFLGTGLTGCDFIQNKEFYSMIIVPNNWSISAEDLEAWTVADVVSLIQQTTFDPLFNAVSFTDNTPDPTTEDFSGGITSVVRNGLPMYQFEFRQGPGFHQAAYSKNSFMTKAVLFIDRAGTIYGSWSADGTQFRGLSVSMLNTQTYRPAGGDTGARTLVDIQLANEVEINSHLAWITEESLGFSIVRDVNPIISTRVVINSASVANGISVTVTGLTNLGWNVLALDAPNFRVIDTTDNSVEPIDTVAEVDGTYTLDMDPALTLGHKVKVQLYDATATPPVATAKDGTLLYKGESKEFTVTA